MQLNKWAKSAEAIFNDNNNVTNSPIKRRLNLKVVSIRFKAIKLQITSADIIRLVNINPAIRIK